MNPLPECCFPHSAPIPHQFVMKVYVDAWIYVTEKFVNMGNIELYEGVLRYEKTDYTPIPKDAQYDTYHYFKDYYKELQTVCDNVDSILGTEQEVQQHEQQRTRKYEPSL